MLHMNQGRRGLGHVTVEWRQNWSNQRDTDIFSPVDLNNVHLQFSELRFALKKKVDFKNFAIAMPKKSLLLTKMLQLSN